MINKDDLMSKYVFLDTAFPPLFFPKAHGTFMFTDYIRHIIDNIQSISLDHSAQFLKSKNKNPLFFGNSINTFTRSGSRRDCIENSEIIRIT